MSWRNPNPSSRAMQATTPEELGWGRNRHRSRVAVECVNVVPVEGCFNHQHRVSASNVVLLAEGGVSFSLSDVVWTQSWESTCANCVSSMEIPVVCPLRAAEFLPIPQPLSRRPLCKSSCWHTFSQVRRRGLQRNNNVEF